MCGLSLGVKQQKLQNIDMVEGLAKWQVSRHFTRHKSLIIVKVAPSAPFWKG